MFHRSNRIKLESVMPGALYVFAGYEAMQLSGDMSAPFLQESNFWWLTGIEEPGWRAIVDTSPHGRTILVRPDVSETHRIFEGGLSDSEALDVSGADDVIPGKEFEFRLRQLARKRSLVYTIDAKYQYDFVLNPSQQNLVGVLKRCFTATEDCSRKLAELRAIKDREEISRMKAAAKLTSEAFAAVREKLGELKYEREIDAEFTYMFGNKGATHAYAPIVASGKNACTLHYAKNSDKLSSRQPILIDIGARVGGYSADVTRTYCLNPTKRQQAVHAALEKAHVRCIDLLGPDVPVVEYFAGVDEVMKDALLEIGALNDRGDDETYRRYFPHSISHGLGVDTHDSLGRPRYFRPGMVLTVEPGIYLPDEGIGMRIEDDILITATGTDNLTGSLSTSL